MPNLCWRRFMFRHLIQLPLLILLVSSDSSAVDTLQVTSPDPVLEDWRWTAFDRSSGLAGRVSDIFEDRDGNIWFATNQGVQRYDGLNWVTYTDEDGLAGNSVVRTRKWNLPLRWQKLDFLSGPRCTPRGNHQRMGVESRQKGNPVDWGPVDG